jgi:hypothetical protein
VSSKVIQYRPYAYPNILVYVSPLVLIASINQHKSSLNNAPSPGNGYSSRGRGGYRGSYGTGGYSSHRYQPTNRWTNNKYIRPGLEGPSSTPTEPTQTPSGSAGPSGVSVAESTSASPSSSGKLSPGLLNGEVDNKGIGATSTAQTVTAFGNGTKEVVIDGIAFESSARSLVRKDCMSFHFVSILVFCGMSDINLL